MSSHKSGYATDWIWAAGSVNEITDGGRLYGMRYAVSVLNGISLLESEQATASSTRSGSGTVKTGGHRRPFRVYS